MVCGRWSVVGGRWSVVYGMSRVVGHFCSSQHLPRPNTHVHTRARAHVHSHTHRCARAHTHPPTTPPRTLRPRRKWKSKRGIGWVVMRARARARAHACLRVCERTRAHVLRERVAGAYVNQVLSVVVPTSHSYFFDHLSPSLPPALPLSLSASLPLSPNSAKLRHLLRMHWLRPTPKRRKQKR